MKTLNQMKLSIVPALTAIFLCSELSAQAVNPSPTENYIHVIEPIYPNTVADGETPGIRTIQYFDGLGRPKQTVMVKALPENNADMIMHYEYDGFGRQVKDYLPVRALSNNGAYVADPIAKYNAYYTNPTVFNTSVYYSEKEMENSPLNRVMKQAAPGDEWKLGSGKEVKLDYQANAVSDQVIIFYVDGSGNLVKRKDIDGDSAPEAYYLNGRLYKNVTTDENGNKVEEYTNKQGQVVLKRTYVASHTSAEPRSSNPEQPSPGLWERVDTYYVHDIYGNLTYVIPPLLSKLYSGTGNLPGDWGNKMNDLGYVYRYDDRNRLIEKKLPGKGWEYMVYDKQDRLVAFQDANLRALSQWLFTKYDKFGRVVYTGLYNGGTSRTSVQSSANNAANNNNETRETSVKFTTNGLGVYYTKTAFPTTFTEILTVNYYDHYNNFSLNGMVKPTQTLDGKPIRSAAADANNSVKGLLTASFVRIIGTNNWEYNYTFYDIKSRATDNYKVNHLGGYTKVRNALDFRGKVDQTEIRHKRISTENELVTNDWFKYDTQERLLKHTHQVGSKPVELIALNSYDQLGQLTVKRVGGTNQNGTNRLQQVDYKYNIRGWLTDINNVNDDLTANRGLPGTNDDLFAFRIQYDKLDFLGGITGYNPAVPLYNGNISQTFWKSSSDNKLRGYSYEYDQMNRLLKANYTKVSLGTSFFPGAYDESLAYDINGNILNLIRYTGDANENRIDMDNLTYTYQNGNSNSNRLMKVTDAMSSSVGFSNGSSGTNNDYTYDENGNMTSDLNKGITNIYYNYLNLPDYIEFGNGNAIEYLYNSAGTKVRKKIYDMSAPPSGLITEVDYLDGFQYAGGILQFFPTAEGYVSATHDPGSIGANSSIYNYVYNYTDHLGNIRMSYTQDPVSGTLEIMEENHYYPFGLKHAVQESKQKYQLVEELENTARPGYVYKTDYNYKYNGKELQDELGLGLYDYGARLYDPALGRWSVIDPLAEMYPDISPYAYAANTPTMFVDYDGRHFGVEIDHDKKKITITGHFYANKEDMKMLNEIASYLNEQTGFVMKVGEGEEAEAYSIGFNITTEESSNPAKSAREANHNDKEGAMYNSFVQNSKDELLINKTSRGSARQTKAAIRDEEGVFAGAHEALHLLGSGHKDGIMKDGSTSGGLTTGIYGAILSGVGIGNGSIGGGNSSAIGMGHIRNEKGNRPAGFTGGTIMNRATFDRQMQRAVDKRERQERREQRRGN